MFMGTEVFRGIRNSNLGWILRLQERLTSPPSAGFAFLKRV